MAMDYRTGRWRRVSFWAPPSSSSYWIVYSVIIAFGFIHLCSGSVGTSVEATPSWQRSECSNGAFAGVASSADDGASASAFMSMAFGETDNSSYYAAGEINGSCSRPDNVNVDQTDGLLVKYATADGAVDWAVQLNSSTGFLRLNSVAPLTDGGVIVCGYATGNIDLDVDGGVVGAVASSDDWLSNGGMDVVIVAYNPNGTAKWGRLIGSSEDDMCSVIKQSKRGSFAWLGTTTGDLYGTSSGYSDLVIGIVDEETGRDLGIYPGVQMNPVSVDCVAKDLAVLNGTDFLALGSFIRTNSYAAYTATKLSFEGRSYDLIKGGTFFAEGAGNVYPTSTEATSNNTYLIAGHTSTSVQDPITTQSPFMLQLSADALQKVCAVQTDLTGETDQIFDLVVNGDIVYLGGASTGRDVNGTLTSRLMVVSTLTNCSSMEMFWLGETETNTITRMASFSFQNKKATSMGFVGISSTTLTLTTSASMTENVDGQGIVYNGNDRLTAGFVDLEVDPLASDGSIVGGGGDLSTSVITAISVCLVVAVAVGARVMWWWWKKEATAGDNAHWAGEGEGVVFSTQNSEIWGSAVVLADENGSEWCDDGDQKEGFEGLGHSTLTLGMSSSQLTETGGVAADVYFKTPAKASYYLVTSQKSTSSFNTRLELEAAMDRFAIDTKDITLLGKLGEGFFGTVYKARWQGQLVAVKSLKHANKKSLEALSREIGVLSAMRHPNVCLFYGCSRPPGTLIVSELLWGSLYQLLHKEKSPIDDIIRFRIMKDVSRGLAYIHSKNFLHRDVSSSNVLLTAGADGLRELLLKSAHGDLGDRFLSNEGGTFAKITDFGLSRPAECIEMTSHAGNLFYMAPEVFKGVDEVTETADVYSFAITIWEMYRDEVPFKGVNPQLVAYQAANDGVRLSLDKIPTGIALLLQDCWHCEPKKRPSCGGHSGCVGEYGEGIPHV